MYLKPRVKFHAAIDPSGNISIGAAYPGFLSVDDASFTKFQYILTTLDGAQWEIGYNDPTKTSGSRRVPHSSWKSTTFPNNTVDLICMAAVTPDGFVNSTPDVSGNMTDPTNRGLSAMSAGPGAYVSLGANFGVALGFNAGVSEDAVLGVAVGSNALVPKGLGIALGARARTANGGEVALGSYAIPTVSFLPIVSPPGADAGGTFQFQAIVNDEPSWAMTRETITKLSASGGIYTSGYIRIQGTVVVKNDSEANTKIFNVDYIIHVGTGSGGAADALTVNNITELFDGGNDLAVTVQPGDGFMLAVTMPAVSDLRAQGLLQISKILM